MFNFTPFKNLHYDSRPTVSLQKELLSFFIQLRAKKKAPELIVTCLGLSLQNLILLLEEV